MMRIWTVSVLISEKFWSKINTRWRATIKVMNRLTSTGCSREWRRLEDYFKCEKFPTRDYRHYVIYIFINPEKFWKALQRPLTYRWYFLAVYTRRNFKRFTLNIYFIIVHIECVKYMCILHIYDIHRLAAST